MNFEVISPTEYIPARQLNKYVRCTVMKGSILLSMPHPHILLDILCGFLIPSGKHYLTLTSAWSIPTCPSIIQKPALISQLLSPSMLIPVYYLEAPLANALWEVGGHAKLTSGSLFLSFIYTMPPLKNIICNVILHFSDTSYISDYEKSERCNPAGLWSWWCYPIRRCRS